MVHCWRLHPPIARGLGLNPGQGTKPCMLQLGAHMPQLRPGTAKNWCLYLTGSHSAVCGHWYNAWIHLFVSICKMVILNLSFLHSFSVRILPLKETYCDLPFGYPRTELIQERQGKCAFFLILFLPIFKITRFCFCNTLSRNQFIFVEGAYCLISVWFALFCWLEHRAHYHFRD